MQTFLHLAGLMTGLTVLVMPVEARKMAAYEALCGLQRGNAARRRWWRHAAEFASLKVLFDEANALRDQLSAVITSNFALVRGSLRRVHGRTCCQLLARDEDVRDEEDSAMRACFLCIYLYLVRVDHCTPSPSQYLLHAGIGTARLGVHIHTRVHALLRTVR